MEERTEPAEINRINNLHYVDDQEKFLDEIYMDKPYKSYSWLRKLFGLEEGE